jgi:hypothetical protein
MIWSAPVAFPANPNAMIPGPPDRRRRRSSCAITAVYAAMKRARDAGLLIVELER